MDLKTVKRARLSCRAAENLLLTDEVLARAGTSWDDLKADIDNWLSASKAHKFYKDMEEFKTGGFDRKNARLKNIRNILIGIMPTTKPWEVLVGQTIAVQAKDFSSNPSSLKEFIGDKMVSFIMEVNT